MKKSIMMMCILLVGTKLISENLTQEMIKKLNTPIVKIDGGRLAIDEYNAINFSKKVIFDEHSVDRVIIKTEARMTKGIIHKDHFIALSSTLSDQIIKSIFMNPQYFTYLKSSEWLISKPKVTHLTIKILFKKDGIDTIVTNGTREQKKSFTYGEIFDQRIK